MPWASGASGASGATTSAAGAVLLAGLAVGVLAQGGYHGPGRLAMAAVVGAAVALSVIAARPAFLDLRLVPVSAALGLAGWALVRGAWTSEHLSGVPAASLLLGVAGVLLLVRRLALPSRDALLSGITVLGVVVAASGWVGVVWHVQPWALPNDGMWRAASTLTYANAAAAVTVPLALVGLGQLTARPRDRGLALIVAVLLLGTVATLSRAGMLSLAVGLLVLGAVLGPGRLLAAALAPLLGAAIAGAGLVPSMPLTSAPGRPLATLALAAGLVVTALLAPRGPRRRARSTTMAVAVIAGLLLAGAGLTAAVSEVVALRADAGASPRVRAAEAALRLVADHPLTGVGPGHGGVRWGGWDGATMTMRFVHNEYLQVLLELGIPGLLVLLVLLGSVVATLRQAWQRPSRDALTGAVAAALAAAAVHAGFDFVWHVPVVPLLLAALLGLVRRPHDRAADTDAGLSPASPI